MNRNRNQARSLIVIGLALIVGIAVMARREDRQHRRNIALIAAVQRNDARAVRAALQAGADPNAVDESHARLLPLTQRVEKWRGRRQWFSAQPTALHLALGFRWSSRNTDYYQAPSGDNLPVIRALLESGANTHTLDRNANCPLAIAVECQEVEAARVLLAAGADINGKNQFGSTHLMRAAMNGDTRLMQMLLERGAQVDTQDDEGMSALLYATSNKQVAAARLLLQYHARADIRGNDGATPLMMAKSQSSPQLVALFKQPPTKP